MTREKMYKTVYDQAIRDGKTKKNAALIASAKVATGARRTHRHARHQARMARQRKAARG